MGFDNLFFLIILASVVGFYLLDTVASLLNLKALRPELPARFADVYDPEKYRKSQEYTRTGTRFDLVQSTFHLVVFLLFWLLGGFRWFDGWLTDLGHGAVVSGLICFGLLFVVSSLLSLPFELYDTFVLEERFGFNKSTMGTFWVDQIKNIGLSAVLGLPLAALILWFFGKYPDHGWLWAWIALASFTLLMSWLAPVVILPLFNKFEPLEDGDLKNAINSMAADCDFPLAELSVMDGSKRSAKSNAFFTGFGKNKRIALYDTLVEQQETDELVAVLAHEIGHFKKKHIVQRMIVMMIQMGVVFFLLSLFLGKVEMFQAFGIEKPTIYFGLVFFTLLFKPVSRILSVFSSIWSRKHEFEADAYAADKTGGPASLISALKKLSVANLGNLTPHPFYSFLYHSHPPVLERIEAMEQQR